MNLPAPPEWTDTTATPALAGYGRRIVAWFVDLLIFVVPAVVLVLLTVDFNADDPVSSVPYVASLVLSAAFVAYQTIMVALRGQTVGAMSMSIVVVRLDSLRKPGWQSSGIRALVPQVAGVVPYIGPLLVALVYGWMFVAPQRQGLHDKAAGTIVVNRSS